MPTDLVQVTAERDGLRRITDELLRLLDELGKLPEARQRLDALDLEASRE